MFWKTYQNLQKKNTRSSHPEVLWQKIFLQILQNLQKNIFSGFSFLIKLQAGNLKLSEVVMGNAFFSFLQISEVRCLKSVYLVEQWQITRRNSQARLILFSYRNQVETSLSSCGHTCTNMAFDIDITVARKDWKTC